MRSLNRLFRKLLEVQGVIVIGAQLCATEDALELLIKRHGNAKPRCPTCDTPMGGELKEVVCRWRHRNIFRKHCMLVGTIREGRCAVHGRRNERVPWAGTRARHTKDFEEAVGRMVQVSNQTATSEFFDIAWRTVGRIVTSLVGRLLPADVLDGLTSIGVDETSYKRGHKYLTVVSCLETGRVVWVGEGKSASTLGTFFELLGKERREKIEVIAMDLGGAFRKAAMKWLPHADIVFDRFHVVQLLTQAITEIRREEAGLAGEDERKALKGTRFLFLKNPKHLRPKDKVAIEAAKKVNKRLARGYELRVDF